MARPLWRFVWNDGPMWRAEEGTRIVGVVNATPDSFSDGGRFLDPVAAADHAAALVGEGADALDIGAESTRPRHTPVPWREEWERLAPVLQAVRRAVSVPISVDTRHAEVAGRALLAGAQAINDVTGCSQPEMARLAAETGSAVIVGHWQPREEPWRAAAVASRLERVRMDLESRGLPRDRIAFDPGLGFDKNAQDNWRLLAGLDALVGTGAPVMVGASRKRFVTAIAGGEADVAARDEVTAHISLWAAMSGAAMVRVHAPAPTRRAIGVASAILAERGEGT